MTQVTLPAALEGDRGAIETDEGRISYYVATADPPAQSPPVLLLHSVNAAASAHEVRPLYDRLRPSRSVYALDLPGFGFSSRTSRVYTARLMTDAVLAMAREIARLHGPVPLDAMAVSLSCEFLARAAVESPEMFGTLALISPTGFDKRAPYDGPPGTNRGRPWLHRTFSSSAGRGLFHLLTTKPSIRYFLEKTWGSKQIDEEMFRFAWLTAHQPGARYAPFSFLSGYLFSADITRVYQSLKHSIWMTHGVRGDFQDYSWKTNVEGRPNWSVDVYSTGALPYFEQPEAFMRRYEEFLQSAADAR